MDCECFCHLYALWMLLSLINNTKRKILSKVKNIIKYNYKVLI